MKTASVLLVAVLAALVPAFAGFSEKRLESEKKAAITKGRLLAFHFEQAYYDPNCPKCVQDVNANNAAMKKTVPKKYAEVITIEADETRNLDQLPQCVRDKRVKQGAQIIVTDVECENVLASITGRPTRDQAKAFEQEVAKAAGK